MSSIGVLHASDRHFDDPSLKLAFIAICDQESEGEAVIDPESIGRWASCSRKVAVGLVSELDEVGEIRFLGWECDRLRLEIPALIQSPVRSTRTKTAVPMSVRAHVYARDGSVCRYCGGNLQPNEMTLDHVLPRSRGGTDQEDNLVVCCRSCNSRKGTKTVQELGWKL